MSMSTHKKVTVTMVLFLAAALALGAMMASTAMADDHIDRGNWLSGVAEPVDIQPGDITVGTLTDGDGEEFTFYTINHNIASTYEGYDTLVQREPARTGGRNVVTDTSDPDDQFDSAWLGVTAPDQDGHQWAITHKGEISWYFEVDNGEWVSLVMQFNGQGELLEVNGVSPE